MKSRNLEIKNLKSKIKNPFRTAGFTLLELLIVIALMVVLAGLLIPAFFKVQNEARTRRARVEAAIIGTAIQGYKMRERKFPAPSSDLGGGEDITYDGQGDNPDNRRVMELLTNAVPTVIDAGKLRWDSAGNAINPWDGQYRIRLDLNYDGKIGGESIEFKVE